MSNYLAVGGVSAVLRSLLTNALTNGGPTSILSTLPGITATSPDLVPVGPDEQARLNIFMYYASYNPALRNVGLPSRNAQGAPVGNPPLALDLHYLVTAYGNNQFDPEILLAWAMTVLHGTPVVPRETIAAALDDLLNNPVTPEGILINGSMLANQIEHIRITPETLSTEEIYRLWTAFQTNYRPTTSYQISVAVIQSTAKLPIGQALMQGMARAVQSADVVTAKGTLDVLRYGSILRSRSLVGLRGAGLAFDGMYFVDSATHHLKPREYKQDFVLKRNAPIANTPLVPSLPY